MVMDPRLRYQYSLKAAREVAKLANGCLSKLAKERPKMSQVVEVLRQVVQISESGAAAQGDPKGKKTESSMS
ncbi:hypothetical protein HPP92_025192 [Vanilla planifolia]|uniref:Uncharacterized protein n=1 Tax=Vanilla planifolia TaxID=51239 RepID=A0A835PM76_VANPL|nr:hypothetical protein HPP92_025192 [Vanilla planifolia]